MNDERNPLPSPNRLVHEPARLAILTVLSSCASADFVFLRGITGLTKGNMSVQLTNLEHAGLVVITKEIIDKKTRTTVRLSDRGGSEIKDYWRTMDEIRSRMAREKRRRSPVRPIIPRPATFSLS
ncbi:MAG TPA: transcriptional regulator [Terriglobales bacterium]|jgi:DNA-binding MarR family transcriptional regulator|nr:transcriptional regulator [Terriglobales bacterium]